MIVYYVFKHEWRYNVIDEWANPDPYLTVCGNKQSDFADQQKMKRD